MTAVFPKPKCPKCAGSNLSMRNAGNNEDVIVSCKCGWQKVWTGYLLPEDKRKSWQSYNLNL